MNKKIFYAIFKVALVAVLFSMALFTAILSEYFTLKSKDELKTSAGYIARGIEDEGRAYLDGIKEGNYRLTWVDRDGTVLFDNVGKSSEMENHLDREEIKEALQSGEGESMRYSKTLMEKSLYYSLLLRDGTVLRLSTTNYSTLSLILGLLQPLCIILALVIISAALLARSLSKSIVKPINELNLDEPLKNDCYEEIEPLLYRMDEANRKLRAQQDKLIEDEGLRREFSANVSHELKTPLQVISGSAELIKDGLVEDKDIEKFALDIYRESARLIKLIDDILKVSRLDEGRGELKEEEIDLYALINEVADSLKDKAVEQAVSIEVRGERSKISTIPSLMREVLYNLIENAVKYNKKGGNVRVSLLDFENKCTIEVADTGMGIPEADLDRIFERFYRVDKSRSKQIGGTGLGLSIVKHSLEIIGGKLSIESKEGEGTLIKIDLAKK